MRHFFPKVVSYNRFVELEKGKNLNLNGQKKSQKSIEIGQKKHTVVFKKTSRGIFENVQCFFQNNGMF